MKNLIKINKIRGLWAIVSTSIILLIIIALMYIFRPINRTIRKSSKIFFGLMVLKLSG